MSTMMVFEPRKFSSDKKLEKSLSNTMAKVIITSADVELLNKELPPEIGDIRTLPFETDSNNNENAEANGEKQLLKSINDLDIRVQILEKLLILKKDSEQIMNPYWTVVLAILAWMANGLFSPILTLYGEKFIDTAKKTKILGGS